MKVIREGNLYITMPTNIGYLLPTDEECLSATSKYTEDNNKNNYGLIYQAHKSGIDYVINYIKNKGNDKTTKKSQA